jgi:hypothetical protein
LGALVAVWCAAWRISPQDARIVVRRNDHPRVPHPSGGSDEPERAAGESEPVHIEL